MSLNKMKSKFNKIKKNSKNNEKIKLEFQKKRKWKPVKNKNKQQTIF